MKKEDKNKNFNTIILFVINAHTKKIELKLKHSMSNIVLIQVDYITWWFLTIQCPQSST